MREEREMWDRVIHGDCLAILKRLPDNSVDAIVTDPPAGIGFMMSKKAGRTWDSDKGGRDQWIAWLTEIMAECLRVIRPGGHALVWSLPRTSHWTGMALEDAGWEIRDVIYNLVSGDTKLMQFLDGLSKEQRHAFMQLCESQELRSLLHVFGSGFPKSSRVDRDERFCQCGTADNALSTSPSLQQDSHSDTVSHQPSPSDANSHNGLSTSHEPLKDFRSDMVAASVEGGDVKQNAHYGKNKVLSSQGDYHYDHDLYGVSPHQGQEDALVSLPSQEYVQEHSHSYEHEDGQLSVSFYIPSQAQCNSLPSNQGYSRPSLSGSDIHGDTQDYIMESENNPTPIDNALSGSRILHKTLQSSAYQNPPQKFASGLLFCLTCGKPVAKGLGSALKPAIENWILVRKPLDGGLAQNVLAWGCGGLNIDQCRVGTAEDMNPNDFDDSKRTAPKFSGILNGGKEGQYRSRTGTVPNGRFPSHLVMSHDPRCIARGTKRVRHGGGSRNAGDVHKSHIFPMGKTVEDTTRLAEDNQEEVQAFECHPSCPVRALGEQSGESTGHKNSKSDHRRYANNQILGKHLPGEHNPENSYGDEGTAARYFQQFHDPLSSLDAPFHYFSKSSRRDRNSGLEGMITSTFDSSEIVMVQLSHHGQTGGSQWENPVLKVQLQVDTAQLPPKVIAVSGISHNNVSEWNTFLFGNSIEGMSLKGCKSTILTRTSSTTESRTLNWLTRSLTNACTADVNSEMGSGGNHAAGVVSSNLSSLTIMCEKAVSLPGVGLVAAKTPLTITASVERHVSTNIDFGTMKSGGSGKPVNGTGLPLPRANGHPTVKSTALMRWLVRLCTPPGGIVLDPFCGSGSTCCAAVYEGMHFIGIEQSNTPDAPYVDIARARIAHAQQEARREESEGQEYQCVDSCPIKQLDAQSGIRKSGARIHPVGEAWPIWDTDTSKRARHTEYEASEGGASRYFQQFAPEPVSLWDLLEESGS